MSIDKKYIRKCESLNDMIIDANAEKSALDGIEVHGSKRQGKKKDGTRS